jgi:DNA-binding PadR family transcriptional regulator
MKFDDIYQFFENPPPNYLNRELAVCYILAVLVQGESYGTEMIENLERRYVAYRISDTVLYGSLKFLEDTGVIAGGWKKVASRGRPRRMYRIEEEWLDRALELAKLWQDYTTDERKAI